MCYDFPKFSAGKLAHTKNLTAMKHQKVRRVFFCRFCTVSSTEAVEDLKHAVSRLPSPVQRVPNPLECYSKYCIRCSRCVAGRGALARDKRAGVLGSRA